MSAHRYLTTRWYVAAWPEEVTRALLARTLLEMPVVLYRKEDGTPVAIEDRCPHRFAPLSRGVLAGDVIECGYHGLRFGPTGRCVLNPHGNQAISNRLHVRDYPVVERHGLIWIWLGPKELAADTPIPDMHFMSGPDSGYKTVHNYIPAKFSSEILIDNLMDLSHAEFLHKGSFSAGFAERSEIKIEDKNDSVSVDRTLYGVDIPPFFIPMFDAAGKPVDHWYIFHWQPPGIIRYEFGVTRPGESRDDGARIYASHIATPESPTTTHYFASISRAYQLHDEELDKLWRQIQYQPVATEDSPMLEAVQKRMGNAEFWSLRPALLQIDEAPVKVRRVMERLIKQQNQTHEPAGVQADGAIDN